MERFISLIIKNPFDYTEWQKNLINEKKTDCRQLENESRLQGI